jgi:outer membrane receptor protein involved in Fe transport
MPPPMRSPRALSSSSRRYRRSLEYSLGYAYTDAEFAESGALYFVDVADGAQLPGHSEHMAAAALAYNTSFQGNDLNFAVDMTYRSDYENGLPGSPQEFKLDGFSIWNAYVSYDVSNWTFRVYGKNLADEDAAVSASLISPQTNRLVLNRPRTLGLSVSYRLE